MSTKKPTVKSAPKKGKVPVKKAVKPAKAKKASEREFKEIGATGHYKAGALMRSIDAVSDREQRIKDSMDRMQCCQTKDDDVSTITVIVGALSLLALVAIIVYLAHTV